MYELNDPLMQEVETLISQRTETTSAFVEEIVSLLPNKAGSGIRENTEKLGWALQELVMRQARDGRMMIDICVALATLTGLPCKKVVQAVQKASKKLNVPSPSWLAKNIRAASLVAKFPSFGQVRDVEKLVSLQRLSDRELRCIASTGQMKMDGEEVIDIVASTRKELTAAIRQKIAPSDVPLRPIDSKIDGKESSPPLADSTTGFPTNPVPVQMKGPVEKLRHVATTSPLNGGKSSPAQTRQIISDGVADLTSQIIRIRSHLQRLIDHNSLIDLPDPDSVQRDLSLAARALGEALTQLDPSWQNIRGSDYSINLDH